MIRDMEDVEQPIEALSRVPAARRVLLPDGTDLRRDQPATRHLNHSGQARVRINQSTGELLEELRGDR